jgi:N-acetylmuramoyl-L-alanine amidase
MSRMTFREHSLTATRLVIRAGLLALVLLGFGTAPSAAASRVLGLRFSSAQAHTRVVLDLTEPSRYSHQVLANPGRMVLDLQSSIDSLIVPLTVNDDLLLRIRVGSLGEAGSRFVFDLNGAADYRISEVPRDSDRPCRLVVDFFSLPGAAPGAGVKGAPGPARSLPPPPVVAVPPRNPAAPYVVVVDAGHGGEDSGARGFNIEEKDVCLSVARKVVDELNRRPGFKAYLSRDGDYFIPLRKRIEIAERRNADAFVSIHANASRSRSARGTEVYFLSLSGATDEASRELAHLENSADLVGGVAPEADDDLSSILFDMQQTDVQQKGSLLAESVVNSLRGYGPLLTRGVKQAGFVVLKSPRIPSILVETAFITHPQENSLLKKAAFRNDFAGRVVDGIARYFASVSTADFH